MALKHTVVTLKDEQGNDVEYQIQAFGAIKGLTVLKKIRKVAVEPMAELFGSEEGVNIGSLASTIIDNLDKIDEIGLVEELMRTVTVNGRDINVDTYFNANYGLLIDLVYQVIKFNFESAFTAGVFQSNFPTADQVD